MDKKLIALAIASMISSGAFAQWLPVGSDVSLPTGNANVGTGDLSVGTTTTVVAPPVVTPGTGTPGAQTITPVGTTTVISTLTSVGDTSTTTTTTTNTGSALISASGDITLRGGSQSVTTQVDTNDVASEVVVDSDPHSITFGQVLSTNFNQVVNQVVGTPTTTTTALGGGNLTMDGRATIRSGLDVNTAAGAGNVGNGVASVADNAAQFGVTNAAGHVNGVSATTTSATMTGGTSSTTWTLDDSGAVLSDSANGQTFSVSNTGLATLNSAAVTNNATVGGTLGVTGNTSLSTLNTSGLATLNSATVTGNLVASTNAYLGGGVGTATMVVTPTTVQVANGATVDMGGNRVQGVAAGVVGTDAVNMNQLNAVNNNLQSQITDNRKEARRGIASVAAVAGIPSLESGKQFNIGVGLGNFKGQTAVAVGANARFAPDVTGKLSIGVSGGDATVSAGIGYSF